MAIFEFDKIILFILFFVPGFISMKVYHLIIASDKIKFSESLSEAIAYSSINYAALSWLILLMYRGDYYENNFLWFVILSVFIIFFAPIGWPALFLSIIRWKWLSKHIISPIKNPWDHFFNKRHSCWIVVNLKSGEKIAGKYCQNSFASSYPHKNQLYLEELWDLNENGAFTNSRKDTKGVIIFGEEIKSIDLYN